VPHSRLRFLRGFRRHAGRRPRRYCARNDRQEKGTGAKPVPCPRCTNIAYTCSGEQWIPSSTCYRGTGDFDVPQNCVQPEGKESHAERGPGDLGIRESPTRTYHSNSGEPWWLPSPPDSPSLVPGVRFRIPLLNSSWRCSHNQQDSMTDVSHRSLSSEHAEPIPSLTDRVAERVMNARHAIESRRKTPRSSSALQDSRSTDEQREIQSLKRVFRDMGLAYRRYRRQAGGPAVPGLRDAAYNFRQNPTLPALVGVAAFLDNLDLLS
jgi:hypothetical protein